MQIPEFELSKVLVALGGNLTSEVGPPLTTLKFALATIRMRTARLLNVSRFFITPCFPAGMGPDYINAVVMFDFGGNPEELLNLLHEIEALFGRRRDSRWGGRVLDLDLLAFGTQISPGLKEYAKWHNMPMSDQLKQVPIEMILPHPRIQNRAFVLRPLMDINPHWEHPVSGLTVSEMYANLSEGDREGISSVAEQ